MRGPTAGPGCQRPVDVAALRSGGAQAEPQPHDPDVKALLRIAVVWNIPVACNRATADFLISSPLLTSDYARAMPDYAAHIDRFLPPR